MSQKNKIPAKLRIISRQTLFSDDGDETQELKVSVSGTLLDDDNSYRVEYSEDNPQSGESSMTILCFDKHCRERVTLCRTGETDYTCVFEKGKRYSTVMSVAGYSLDLCIDTRRLVNRLTDKGGRLDIDYGIELGAALAQENKYSLFISPDNGAE